MDLKDIAGQPIPAHFCSIIELVAERLSTVPDVLSIMVCGSVARGWGDDYSDLDIYVMCKSISPESVRRNAYVGFGPPLSLSTMEVTEHRMRCDEFDIHQETGRTPVFLEFETHHSASQWVERIINMENASEDDLHRASSLQDGLIIFDLGEILNYLRDGIHPMPDSIRRFLVAKAVERMTDGYAMECAKKSALRGDVFSSYRHLLDLITRIAHVCLSFNGKYYPGDKNLQGHLSYCAILTQVATYRQLALNSTKFDSYSTEFGSNHTILSDMFGFFKSLDHRSQLGLFYQIAASSVLSL